MCPDHSSDLVCLLYVKMRICNPPAALPSSRCTPLPFVVSAGAKRVRPLIESQPSNEPSHGSEHARPTCEMLRSTPRRWDVKRYLALAVVVPMAFTVTVSGRAPRGVRLQPDVSASEQSGRGGRAPAAAAPSAPQLKFHIEEEFFKWPTNVWPSEAVGVALNSQKHIFLLNRGNVPLLEFAPDGAFIRSMGEGSTIFHAAHSVRFDAEDNMWLVDAGNNVVVKFNNKGRIVQALGRWLE